VHLDRELLDQVVILVVAHVQVFSVFRQHSRTPILPRQNTS
jgi:hypothetical protein